MPSSWKEVQLEDIVVYSKGKRPETLSNVYYEGAMPYLDIEALEKNNIYKYCDSQYSTVIDEDSLAIVWDGARSGYVFKGKKGILGSTLMKITPFISKDYLYYFFLYKEDYIKSNTKGSGIPHVNPEVFWKIKVPIPPAKEQNRIVDVIEELFSGLDYSINLLNKNIIQLDAYKESILKYALEGKLTEKWRYENKLSSSTKYSISNGRTSITLLPTKLTNEEKKYLPPIPNNWIWVRNDDLLHYVTSGSRDWRKYYSSKGALFVRTQNINTNSLILENVAYVDLPTNVEGKRSLIEKGDLLMTITGANVGKIAFVSESIKEAYVSQSVALMKPIEKAMSPYLHLYFQSKLYGGKIISNLVYGVGRPVLSLQNIRDALVVLPPIEEQQIMVAEIDSQFSIIHNLKKTIETTIIDIKALKYSILKQAFSGKLVNPHLEYNVDDLLNEIFYQKNLYNANLKANNKIFKRKKRIMMDKEILEILKNSKNPISAKALWEQSVYKDNIELFYAELKKISSQIVEIEKGIIILKDENRPSTY